MNFRLSFVHCFHLYLGEDWRDAKKMSDSDFHILPKVQCQVVFSNSVKPEYRQLPRYLFCSNIL